MAAYAVNKLQRMTEHSPAAAITGQDETSTPSSRRAIPLGGSSRGAVAAWHRAENLIYARALVYAKCENRPVSFKCTRAGAAVRREKGQNDA